MFNLPQKYKEIHFYVSSKITSWVEIPCCETCGLLVGDQEQHNKWHGLNTIGFG